eukprot:357607-Chlamydomonas_euryale.AAC.5
MALTVIRLIWFPTIVAGCLDGRAAWVVGRCRHIDVWQLGVQSHGCVGGGGGCGCMRLQVVVLYS